MHDFLYYPAIGLQTSPLAFLSGVVRGTSSLTRRTLSSMCDTAGDLSEALQVGLLALGVVDSSFASQQLQRLTYSPAVSAKVTDGETGGALFGNRKSSGKGMLLSEEARTDTGSSRTARIKPLIDVQSSSSAGRDQGDGGSRAINGDALTGGEVWNARDRRPKGVLEGVVQGQQFNVHQTTALHIAASHFTAPHCIALHITELTTLHCTLILILLDPSPIALNYSPINLDLITQKAFLLLLLLLLYLSSIQGSWVHFWNLSLVCRLEASEDWYVMQQKTIQRIALRCIESHLFCGVVLFHISHCIQATSSHFHLFIRRL